MEFDVIVQEDGAYCLVTVRGRVELAKYEPSMMALLTHPGVEPGMTILYDLRAAEVGQLSISELRGLMVVNRRLSARRGNARSALVVRDALHYGLARVFQALGISSNVDAEIFMDYEEAVAWVQGVFAERRRSAAPLPGSRVPR